MLLLVFRSIVGPARRKPPDDVEQTCPLKMPLFLLATRNICGVILTRTPDYGTKKSRSARKSQREGREVRER